MFRLEEKPPSIIFRLCMDQTRMRLRKQELGTTPACSESSVPTDGFVALQAAEGELQLRVPVPVRVRARWSGALLPRGRVAG
jgi:hypothetical protein